VDTQSAPPIEKARRILIVDDDMARRELFGKLLRSEGHMVDLLVDGTTLVEHVRIAPPDLVLLDIMLPQISGFDLCRELRSMQEMRLVPIILITSAFADEESVVRGLHAGADDYITTPSRIDEVRARVRVQLRNRRDRETLEWARAQRASLRQAAMSDALTGLANRRDADHFLEAALRGGQPLLAVLIDVDHFKRVNDTRGHAAGDAVLVQVAQAIRSCTRAGDLAARYGGEEFLVIVQGAPLAAGERIGERYRQAVRAAKLSLSLERRGPEPDAPLVVTASVGVAGTLGGSGASRDALLAAADRALYEAKQGGRNQVVASQVPVSAAPHTIKRSEARQRSSSAPASQGSD
jgi:diguanylate cyclase (GGDEF)-like protein